MSGMADHWNDVEVVRSRFVPFVRDVLGLKELAVVPVEHSTKVAFGFTIRGARMLGDSKQPQKPWKIVYSGDTVPCPSLVQAGMDCDLLIHEATFQDGLELEAGTKRHSTVGQALAQATAMRARHTLLTHFSARYSCAVPALRPESCGAGFAYDHMCVSLLDLPRLPRLAAMLQCVFPKHFAELERRCNRLRGHKRPMRDTSSTGGRGGTVKHNSPNSPSNSPKRRRIHGQP